MKNKFRLFGFFLIASLLSNLLSAQHFEPIWVTLNSGNPQVFMQIVITSSSLDGVILEDGDEIAVFDVDGNGDEICVGVEVLPEDPFVIEAGEELSPGADNGFTEGNTIIFRFWDNSESREITLIDPTFDLTPPLADVYEGLGAASVSLLGYSKNTWTGATDTDWNTASNWNSKMVTSETDNVIIPTGIGSDYPVLTSTSTGTCNNLTIESDATGNGSIIKNQYLTINGTTTVQRYFEGYNDGAPNGWHNISSPVNNMTIADSDFDFQSGDGDDLYLWNEPTTEWYNYKGPNTFTSFENGRGYLCALQDTRTISFVGTLNESSVTVSPLSFESGGWHLRGNPFASAIEWNNNVDWVISGIATTAKIWNQTGGNYSDITAGGIIPSTNGFFVEIENATNTLTIPASARVHDGTNNYKKSNFNELPETLVLTITNDVNSYFDVNRTGFKAEATEAWDYQFDSHKLFGEETAPQLWTISNDDDFSQNYLPHAEGPYQVLLNFRAGVDATYYLNADGLGSFEGNTEIFLEDLLTDNLINLNEQQDYEFTASTEDSDERFILHFNGLTGIGEEISNSDINIYANRNTVYIHFKDMPKEASQIDIFNIVGQKVYAGSVEPGNLNKIELNENAGVYIVRLKTGDNWITQKVTIN